ncbi:MAG: nucleotide sugar dehydrogenase [Erythrobacter sp.]|uniref:nucleotide sugar dehydrogenase n=1 Tax=Erythrobacter sp. TaxID=1042 RepID=UPI0032EDB144
MTEAVDETVAVIGLGKLGLALAAAIGSRGRTVTGYDIDPNRGRLLADAPIDHAAFAHERGLGEAVRSARPNIAVASSIAEAVAGADITFVVVPTPSRDDGSFCTDAAVSALKGIGTALRDAPPVEQPPLIVLVSTVSPGSTCEVLLPALQDAAGGPLGEAFCFCYAPALVALGTVLDGFLSPDFAFVGQTEEKGGKRLAAFLADILAQGTPIHRMSAESVEIAKIGLNNFLTMKISFSNLIGQLCHASPGARARDVLDAIGADRRVGPSFLGAGMGYGGPCLPRDTAALAHALMSVGLDPQLPSAAARINTSHNDWLVSLIGQVEGKTVCVWGLSYRAGSNISIDSASIALANTLDAAGAKVIGIDPLVGFMELDALSPGIATTADLAEATSEADTLVLTIPLAAAALERLKLERPNLQILDVLDSIPDDVPEVIRFGSGA